ncbi:phospholipase, patatin family protein [Acanthamoeba castellanii str. Neff]|uniref:Phospholipase, patatin family protein n=1 Tax=Acanthamoeba castellanii (strain ATCC 30010 / Neff) TaxID=1257118 RepID=L8H4C2_ACACF|nr:phospholipase, patatin family protein [Acanthamoeba castellanii str. Neff]ELR19553.1 phospholipase, patatin family protein [Acanthamoeba castellanii str. Neff]
MDAVASTAGVAAALVGTQEGKEVDNGIQHDTHKDDTKPSSAHGLVHKKRRRSRTLSNGHPTSPEGEEERRGKDKKNETEKERREGGGGDEKERSPTPARLRATSPTSSPHTTRSRQGAAVLPALSLSVLTQHQVVHKDKQPSPPQQPDNKKKKGSWRKIGSGPLKKPHHDDNIAEQEDHEMAQFEKIESLAKDRCLCGMLMPSMVTTDRDKMGTALLQLEPSHLLFARLHFKGGGRRLSVEEWEEDKISVPKFIFADVEAFPFSITLKEYGFNNWQKMPSMPSPRGTKEREGDSYRLAAMECGKTTAWLKHLQPKESPPTSTRPSRSFGPPKYDFLWLQRKENSWNRYFCVASGDYLEWYILGPVKSIPLDSIVAVDKGRKVETLRMGRSESKIKRNVIRVYDTWLNITWKNEYDFENTTRFYFQSDEEASAWYEPLSRLVSAADNSNATAATGGLLPAPPAFDSSSSSTTSSSSSPASGAHLIQSSPARVRINASPTKNEAAEEDSSADSVTVAAAAVSITITSSSPASSSVVDAVTTTPPRDTTASVSASAASTQPSSSATSSSPTELSPPPLASTSTASTTTSTSPFTRKPRRSNSLGPAEESRKWTELVPRMLRRESTTTSIDESQVVISRAALAAAPGSITDAADAAAGTPERERNKDDVASSGDDLGNSLSRAFLDIRLPSPNFNFSSTWLQTVMENRKSNKYRKFSVEDMDPYSAYDKNDGKMRFFAPTSVKDPAVNRSLQLRNVIREFVEKANNETGKTPFGDYIPHSPRDDKPPSPRRADDAAATVASVDTKESDDAELERAAASAAPASEGLEAASPKEDDENKSKRPFFILCLDGGGLKSILEATILERLVAVFPDLLERVNLFAGVSGGSMLCSCLASGRSAMFIRALMEGIMPYLVEGERTMNTVAGFGMKKAKYTHTAMRICGEEILNGIKMGELPKQLLIMSFLLDNVDIMRDGDDRTWMARAYHNIPMHPDNSGVFLGAVHVDGGVVANNPSLTAAITVTGLKAKNRQPMENIRILSLGTGTGDQHDWGLLKWGPKLTEVLFGAANNNVDFLTNIMLGQNYHRLDPHMEEKLPMDDPAIAIKLVELGRSIVLDDTIEWIRVHVYGGVKSSSSTTSADDDRSRERAATSPGLRRPGPLLRKEKKRHHMWKSKANKLHHPGRESDDENDDDADDVVHEACDEVDSDDDADDDGGGGGGDDKESERKRLKKMRRLWAKRRAKSDVSQKLPARHRGKTSLDAAHTVGGDVTVLMERAESSVEIHHHQQANSSTTDDEDERKTHSFSDAGTIIKNEKESLTLFSDARRRAKKIKMKPFSGKLKRRKDKERDKIEKHQPDAATAGGASTMATKKSASFTSSSSKVVWLRRRGSYSEEDDDEGGNVEEEEECGVEESGHHRSHQQPKHKKHQQQQQQQQEEEEEDEGGGVEKATSILKSIFGLT